MFAPENNTAIVRKYRVRFRIISLKIGIVWVKNFTAYFARKIILTKKMSPSRSADGSSANARSDVE
jgi:hypothetical protein